MRGLGVFIRAALLLAGLLAVALPSPRAFAGGSNDALPEQRAPEVADDEEGHELGRLRKERQMMLERRGKLGGHIALVEGLRACSPGVCRDFTPTS